MRRETCSTVSGTTRFFSTFGRCMSTHGVLAMRPSLTAAFIIVAKKEYVLVTVAGPSVLVSPATQTWTS